MKKLLFILLAFLLSNKANSQSFYDLGTIQDIKIYFGFSNWDYIMDTAIVASDSYTTADSVVINGNTFTNSGVRYKGNSSYNASRPKNPLHIKLDFVSGQNYQGFQDIKLANGFSDPSMIRETSSYEILRRYMDAPRSNFAKVFINGSYYGIMTNDENIGDDFLDQHYFSSAGTFVKGNPESVITGNGSSLLYLGTDSALYSTFYDMKTDGGWKNLINLCDSLNNFSSSVNNFLDIDRILWMLAFNNVLVNLDSYSGSFRQNFYLYRNHQNQWIPTVWDVNMSFGSFVMSGVGGPMNLIAMQNMTPLLHQTDANWPLISKLLSNSQYNKMYLAHMRTIHAENFLGDQYKTSVASMRTLIDNAVQTDVNYLYTYPQYLSNLDSTVTGGGPGGGTCGVYQLMNTRTAYLNSSAEFQQVAPVITSVVPSNSSPAFGSAITISASITNSAAAYLGYRYSKSDRFVRIPMFDDGAHGDGAIGDNVFGASIPVSSLQMQYYLYAENVNAGIFSPERAEHEFYSLTPTIAMATTNDVVINEFLANNALSNTNEDGKHKDWIELYNKTSNALGLGSLFLSDSIGLLAKWQFPPTAFIPANGFFLVWADDKDSLYIDCHTNFNLENNGDNIFLSNSSVIADQISFSVQPVDTAQARCPDGTGSFQSTVLLTPRSSNVCSLVGKDNPSLNGNRITLFPNPFCHEFKVNSENGILKKIQIYNMLGMNLFNINPESAIFSSGEMNNLTSGIYLLIIVDQNGTRSNLKLIKQE